MTVAEAPGISEAAFQAQVLAYARMCGWLAHHSRPAANRRGRVSTPIAGDAGLPDLVLVRAGRVLFLELKAGRGKLSPAQRAWAAAIVGIDEESIEAGVLYSPGGPGSTGPVYYVCAYPRHWDLLEVLLRRRFGAARE